MVTAAIVGMYEEGMTSRQIADVVGLSFRTVLRRLQAAGVERRNSGNPAIKELQDAQWLRDKYESGLSTTQIAKELNCQTTIVSQWLKRHGIQARPVGSKAGWKFTDEGRRNLSEAKRGKCLGEANPNWKGGSKPDPVRNRYQAKVWVKTVKERDCWTCVQCGAKDKLHAHHIKSWKLHPELRFDVDNGTTLCEHCHQAAHGFVFPWNRHAETSTSAQPH